MKYESATNRRLHNPSHAQELAVDAASGATADASTYRVVLGLGPGRSGTKSLTELLAAQTQCVHAEHKMVVQRRYRRDESGRIDPRSAFVQQQNKKKGSWGSDRRLEWDAPRLARGATPLTEQEEATWRVLRLLEQRRAFDEWVFQDGQTEGDKPRKLGARGWKNHNSSSGEEDDDVITGMNDVPVVAAVSSAGLAYVHEYIALDPSVRIVVLMRPREEVAESFLKKSKGRNHWQRHERRKRRSPDDEQLTKNDESVQADKTWDCAFPNMSADECRQFILVAGENKNGGINEDDAVRPDKASAIRAYWELYNEIALGLVHQYPSNVRVFEMYGALNDVSIQEELLRFVGFDEPVLLTSSEVHLNKKKK